MFVNPLTQGEEVPVEPPTMEVLNISGIQTVPASKYHLDQIDQQSPIVRANPFLVCLLNVKHVMYDWGLHCFWTCQVPFVVDYDRKVFLAENTGDLVADDQWVGSDPDNLHEVLAHQLNVFADGKWGPTAIDTILRMELSGVTVDLSGQDGPPDHKKFMAELRAALT